MPPIPFQQNAAKRRNQKSRMKPIDGWRILPPHLFSSKDILPTLRATLFDENGHESIVCSEQNAIFLTKLGLFLVARSFCDFFSQRTNAHILRKQIQQSARQR